MDEVKREPADLDACTTPVIESPSSTPGAASALALPSSTNDRSTLTAAGFAGVVLERRERALYLSGSSYQPPISPGPVDRRGSDGYTAGQQAAGSGGAHVSTAQSTNTAVPRELGAPAKRARRERFSFRKTHTYWWLEYASDRGLFKFKFQRKQRGENEPNPFLKNYKCAKCGWVIDVLTSNNECFTESDPAGNVHFDGNKQHLVDCIFDEPAVQVGQQQQQAAPNNNAEADNDVLVCGTGNNGRVAANRARFAVAPWVQNAHIFEETTRTYYRSKEVYLAIKKTQHGWK